MNRRWVWWCLLVLLVPFVSAEASPLSLLLLSPAHTTGETVQAFITAEQPAQPITPQHITLRNQQGMKQTMSPFLTVINATTTLLTFDLETSLPSGIYVLSVDNVLFLVDNVLKSFSSQTDLAVTASPYGLSFYPAGVVLVGDALTITVKNRKERTSVNVTAPTFLLHSYSIETTLNQGSSKSFSFRVDENALSKENISASTILFSYSNRSYSVQMFIPPTATPTEAPEEQSQVSQKEKKGLSFVAPSPSLKRTLEPTQVLQGDLSIANNGPEEVSNISIALTGNLKDIVTVDPLHISSLAPNSTATLTIIVNQRREPLLTQYTGTITASTLKETLTYPMEFMILIPTTGPAQQSNESKLFTQKKEEQPADFTFTAFNLSSTEEKEPQKPAGALIVLIILIIGAIIYVLGRKKVVKRVPFTQYVGDLERKKG